MPPIFTVALARGFAVELRRGGLFFDRVFVGGAVALRAAVALRGALRAVLAERCRAVPLAVLLIDFLAPREPVAVFAPFFFCGLVFLRAFAAAVFRRPPALRAAARPPALDFRFAGVSFRPRALLLDPDFLVLFFFAILMPLKMVCRV
ncbi:MAG: hypothetical protein M3541_18660 [Acidobacteriota bacterium]|nr:hypothetical protein [Acidobacteriota bacterium]